MKPIEIKEFSLLYIILKKPDLIRENYYLIDNVKLFSNENKIIFESILDKIKIPETTLVNDLLIDPQILEKISKFASIKHILKKLENDEYKIIELLEEILRDIKNYELELRIEELESKFSKDLNENTFNEIRELKKLQKIN